MPPAAFIEVANVSKVYGKGRTAVEAVARADFSAEEGEFVSIIGPSGCGKSTLLMMIAGLEERTTGSITIDGSPVTGPIQDAGVVFQGPVLLPWRSIVDNVLLPIELMGKSTKAFIPKAEELLAKTGIYDFRHHLPHQLSGGMKQRASICRAMIHDPKILLMDEPFSALDALTREEMGMDLAKLVEQEKKSVIFVTHNIREAVLLSDRVLVMSKRPSKIVENIKIELPKPRSLDMEETVEFNSYCRHLRDWINKGVAA